MFTFLRRLPWLEVLLVAGLLLGAGLTSWAGGRSTLLPEAFKPLLAGATSVAGGVRGGAGFVRDLEVLRTENASLSVENVRLRSELARLADVEHELERLRRLLSLEGQMQGVGRAARVIGRSPDNWHARVYLDRGARDGVALDAIVMASGGVVGRIMAVGPGTSEVSLVTDPGNQVGCLDQRSRSAAILVGTGEQVLELRYMQQQVDFRMGDLLLTSGYGGVYPKGLPLGRVARVIRQPNAIVPQVQVVPEVALDEVEEVLVLDPLAGPL